MKMKIQTIIIVSETREKYQLNKWYGLIGLSPLPLATPLSAQCSVRPIKLLVQYTECTRWSNTK